MTVVAFPTGIDVAGKNKLQFVPTLADAQNPTVAEIDAGFPIECAIYDWQPKADQPTSTESRFCLREDIESLGKVKYSIDPIKYVYDPQRPKEATGLYGHYAKLEEGLSGFIIDRRGLDYDTVAYQAGQFVDVYPVTLGVKNRTPIDTGNKDSAQKYTVEQSVAVSGPVQKDRAIK